MKRQYYLILWGEYRLHKRGGQEGIYEKKDGRKTPIDEPVVFITS